MEDCYRCLRLCCCFNNKYFDDRKSSVKEAREKLDDVLKVPVREDSLPASVYLPLTFIPDLLVKAIPDLMLNTLPYSIDSEAVMLIVDVCGFTNIAESYCQKGISGIEEIASILNGFMSTLAAMLISAGGDILSFGGDAFLVHWKERGDKTERNHVVVKVFNCALSLQTHESLKAKNLNDKLQVKIGIAKGKMVAHILGCLEDFMLCAIAGDVLPEAHKAEELCSAGDIIVTTEVYRCLQKAGVNTFNSVQLTEGFVKIMDYRAPDSCIQSIHPQRERIFRKCSKEDIVLARKFSIPSVRDVKSPSELKYLSELTLVSILFVLILNVEEKESEILGESCDIILNSAANQGVAEYNWLSNCEKYEKSHVLNMSKIAKHFGFTYLVIFGLPGLKHSNDPARCLLCSRDIANKHASLGISVSIGVATGTCFCGLVGHPLRQEYTVMGSRVNMASRLMIEYSDELITMDAATYHLSRDELGDNSYIELPTRKLKGIELAGSIYGFRLGHKRNIQRNYGEEKTPPSISSIVVNENDDIRSIRNCVKAMCDEDERAVFLEKTLLPVIIVEGVSACSSNYLIYKAIEIAAEMNYKVFSCCTIPICAKDEFLTAASLFQKIIGLLPEDNVREKEEKILNALSGNYKNSLYLLNHLFRVRFPPPSMSNTIKRYRNLALLELFRAIYTKVCKTSYTLLAVDEIDFMDEQSFLLLRTLAETENVLIVMGVSKQFKEPSVSASLLYLKAHTIVDLRVKSDIYCAPLICWFLHVIGVHKEFVLRLTEGTDGNLELLQEVCLSSYVTDYTVLVPLKDIDKESMENFYFCDLVIPENYKNDQILVLDIKPGVTDLKSLKIPDTVSDAIKDHLNYLSVQDRLILKKAALMGTNFTQCLIEAVSPKLTSEQVVESINSLMQKNIISVSCASYHFLDIIPVQKRIFCYNMCFCSMANRRQAFRSYRVPTRRVGLYHNLSFRRELLRQWMISFMTAEQCETMQLEIAYALETSGVLCPYCKRKGSEKVQVEGLDKTELHQSHLNFKQCACLLIRPRLYKIISSLNGALDINLMASYFLKKCAQACNDLNYPVQALNCAERAENMLPDVFAFAQTSSFSDEKNFDQDALKASIKRTQARSCLLLKNTYSATICAQQALEKLGMELIYFFGVFKPQEFKHILPKLGLLYAEEITKAMSLLSQSFVAAKMYDVALKVLDIEFVALTYYPTDFVQVVTYMISLYLCRTRTSPRKRFRKLESNTLKICLQRIQNYKVYPTAMEIHTIGNAYVTIIEANLSKNYLKQATLIAQEAMMIQDYVNDYNCTILLYLLLVDINIFYRRSEEYWKYLNKLQSLIGADCNYDIFARYYCALSTAIFLDFKSNDEKLKNSWSETEYIEKCNEFASKWNINVVITMPKDLALYVSAKMSVWCHKASAISNWPERESVFHHCYEMTVNLFEDQFESTYWSVGGILAFLRMKLPGRSLEDLKENQDFVSEQLKVLKENVMVQFPVYEEEYKQLLSDTKKFEPEYSSHS